MPYVRLRARIHARSYACKKAHTQPKARRTSSQPVQLTTRAAERNFKHAHRARDDSLSLFLWQRTIRRWPKFAASVSAHESKLGAKIESNWTNKSPPSYYISRVSWGDLVRQKDALTRGGCYRGT